MTDPEGMIALLEDEAGGLQATDEVRAGGLQATRPGPSDLTDEDWQDDPVPRKWDKIRSVFLNAKTAAEVRMAAEAMPVRSWLEWACRMTQRQIEMPPMQISVVRVELPPRADGPAEGRTIEVELPTPTQACQASRPGSE